MNKEFMGIRINEDTSQFARIAATLRHIPLNKWMEEAIWEKLEKDHDIALLRKLRESDSELQNQQNANVRKSSTKSRTKKHGSPQPGLQEKEETKEE
ncbi:DUF6290 family protein [Chloroflexota bacterium]